LENDETERFLARRNADEAARFEQSLSFVRADAADNLHPGAETERGDQRLQLFPLEAMPGQDERATLGCWNSGERLQQQIDSLDPHVDESEEQHEIAAALRRVEELFGDTVRHAGAVCVGMPPQNSLPHVLGQHDEVAIQPDAIALSEMERHLVLLRQR